MTTKVHPVILSGGTGTRLWPLSVPSRPKPFVNLLTRKPMIAVTRDRVSDPAFYAAPLIVSNNAYLPLLQPYLDAQARLILEPFGRNTAAAVALAAISIHAEAPDAVMLVLASDHAITDVDAFQADVERGAALAVDGYLVTFGIEPTEPHSGYGYIERGFALDTRAWRIARFVEKPSREAAETMLETNRYCWNSGIFMFTAARVLEELERHAPALLEACKAAMADSLQDGRSTTLRPQSFAQIPSVPFDIAVMEKTTAGVMLSAGFDWSDVGDWNELYKMQDKDAELNVIEGSRIAAERVRGSYLRNDTELPVYISDLDDLIVVVNENGVFISAKTSSQSCKRGGEIFPAA